MKVRLSGNERWKVLGDETCYDNNNQFEFDHLVTNSDLRSIPHQKCTEFEKINLKSILFFYQKFPAVANGEEEEEDEDDDDDDDDDEDEDEDDEEESRDVTVVDTEEVNVHDKLIWDYMCFIHCFMHVK